MLPPARVCSFARQCASSSSIEEKAGDEEAAAAAGGPASAFLAAVSEWDGSRPGWLDTVTTTGIDMTGKARELSGVQPSVTLMMPLPRDGQERDQGGNGGYNERNEGWEDRRGGGGGHQQSLLRPNYLGSGSNDITSFSPGRPALMASPGAMKVMGGAGITENLDRPNMPVTTANHHQSGFSSTKCAPSRFVNRSRSGWWSDQVGLQREAEIGKSGQGKYFIRLCFSIEFHFIGFCFNHCNPMSSSREERRKKRKSRWTDEACKTFIPGHMSHFNF